MIETIEELKRVLRTPTGHVIKRRVPNPKGKGKVYVSEPAIRGTPMFWNYSRNLLCTSTALDKSLATTPMKGRVL